MHSSKNIKRLTDQNKREKKKQYNARINPKGISTKQNKRKRVSDDFQAWPSRERHSGSGANKQYTDVLSRLSVFSAEIKGFPASYERHCMRKSILKNN